MYRDLFLSRGDGEKLQEQGLRYDITIIPPNMLGQIYQTAGHYHPLVPEGASPILSSTRFWRVKRYISAKPDLGDVVVVHASAGDKVLVPPNYGHITINRSNKTLKMANYVAGNSLHFMIHKGKSGGAYFFTKKAGKERTLSKCSGAAARRGARQQKIGETRLD